MVPAEGRESRFDRGDHDAHFVEPGVPLAADDQHVSAGISALVHKHGVDMVPVGGGDLGALAVVDFHQLRAAVQQRWTYWSGKRCW